MIADYIQLMKCVISGTKEHPTLDYFNTRLANTNLTFEQFVSKCKWRYEDGKENEYD
jgi:hypothetical protein